MDGGHAASAAERGRRQRRGERRVAPQETSGTTVANVTLAFLFSVYPAYAPHGCFGDFLV